MYLKFKLKNVNNPKKELKSWYCYVGSDSEVRGILRLKSDNSNLTESIKWSEKVYKSKDTLGTCKFIANLASFKSELITKAKFVKN